MEHERWSHSYKEFATFQLERAQEDVQSAEDQLKSVEEYISWCSIIDAIRCLGFMVEFIDSDTVAVVKIHDSMFLNILYSNLLTANVLIRNPYRLSVRLCHIFASWLSCIYIAKFVCLTISNYYFACPFTLSWQIMTRNQGRRLKSILSHTNKLIFFFFELSHSTQYCQRFSVMPSRSNPSKRKADVPPTGENKSARTSNFTDAPTSKRQGMCLATFG